MKYNRCGRVNVTKINARFLEGIHGSLFRGVMLLRTSCQLFADVYVGVLHPLHVTPSTGAKAALVRALFEVSATGVEGTFGTAACTISTKMFKLR